MKRIYALLALLLFSGFGLMAQENKDCDINLSLENGYVKSKNYNEALPYWEKVHTGCPDKSEAIYSDGIKIFKAKLLKAKKAKDEAVKKEMINKVIGLYDEWIKYFPKSKYIGKIYQDKGLLLLNNKMASKTELYSIFDNGFKKGKSKFINPKALYGYFTGAVEKYKNNELSFEELIEHYNEIGTSIETLVEKYTLIMEDLQKRQEEGELLKKEEKKLNGIKKNIPVYDIVSKNMDKYLGELGDCEHLVPLYSNTYEENKSNTSWLRKAARNLSNKNCSKDPIFRKLVVQLDNLEPSYSSAFYLAIMYEKEGKSSKAIEYYKKAISLSEKNYDKASIYLRLAKMSKRKGQKAQARAYAYKALNYKPSMGRAYLLIADLYASSANDCGSDLFEKRATYWLAMDMANKAASVDPALAKHARKVAANNKSKAPTKTMVFMDEKKRTSVTMKCWIKGSVKVRK